MAFAGSYESVKRYMAKLRKADSPLAHRIEVQPAEDVHMDFEAATVAQRKMIRRLKKC